MQVHTDRAVTTFEFELTGNDVPTSRAVEAALHLMEILSRIELPAAETIPNMPAGAEDAVASWTIPLTEIRMVRKYDDSGKAVGYLFSRETVARLPEFFRQVQHLPVKPGFEAYDGIVERFRLRPGLSAPDAMVTFIQQLPPPWFRLIGGEPLWKWLTLLLAVVMALLLFLMANRLASSLGGNAPASTAAARYARPLVAVAAMLLLAFIGYVAVDVIRLTGNQREVVLTLLAVLTHAVVIWLIFMLAERVANGVIRIRRMSVYVLDTQLVRLVSKLVAVFLTVYVLVNLAETFGISVAPMLAGLGIGGLAVALAVRPTLENVIAGFVLFADAPVRVGDFCSFGDKLGTVEAIGLRSVRVRSIDRTLIAIPNAEFCQLQLVNFTRRDGCLLRATLGLHLDTSADQLRLVLTRLRELLIRHPKVSPDPARVRFLGYSDSALDVELFALVQTRDFSEFLAIQEDINLRIKDIVEQSGSAFAYPSQTLYMERSHGLDKALAEAAESEVAKWRSANELPFPDIDEQTRSDLSNTLDYPPEGSSKQKLRKAGED
jgi:MscS family membrane protein